MAMDDRQQQIQVGAGLQESRLNTDLIAWLEKYGTWILSVLCVVVLSYSGWKYYQRVQRERSDTAFMAYEAARGTFGADGILTGSPDGLLAVAAEHEGAASVSLLASLDAAEIYLGSLRRGLRPGADVMAPKPEDTLDAAQRTDLAQRAGDLFEKVRARTTRDPARAILNLRARWGLSAVAASKGDIPGATAIMADYEKAARGFGFDALADQGAARIKELATLTVDAVTLRDADLPPLPAMNPPAPPSMGAAPIQPQPIQIQPAQPAAPTAPTDPAAPAPAQPEPAQPEPAPER